MQCILAVHACSVIGHDSQSVPRLTCDALIQKRTMFPCGHVHFPTDGQVASGSGAVLSWVFGLYASKYEFGRSVAQSPLGQQLLSSYTCLCCCDLPHGMAFLKLQKIRIYLQCVCFASHTSQGPIMLGMLQPLCACSQAFDPDTLMPARCCKPQVPSSKCLSEGMIA